MTQYPNQFTPPPAMTPPLASGEIPQPPSTWPTVIGVISIVLGSLGVLTHGCCGMLGNVFTPMMAGFAEDDPVMQAQMQMTQQYLVWNILSGVVLTALAALLLASGIGVARRRRWSVRASIIWAILRILAALPQAILTYGVMVATFEAMEQASADTGQPMPPGMHTFMNSIGVLTIFLTVAFAAIWPIFLLIWFSRRRIKDEVATWN